MTLTQNLTGCQKWYTNFSWVFGKIFLFKVRLLCEKTLSGIPIKTRICRTGKLRANTSYLWRVGEKQESHLNEYSRNVEKCGIPVNVKLMTRWNVNGTAAAVCHSRAKIKPRPPTAVKPQRCLQQRPVHFLHELFIFLQIKNTPREQSVMKGFLLGFVRHSMEGPFGLPHLVISTCQR